MSEEKRNVDYGENNKITALNDFIEAEYPAGITATDLKMMRFIISQCRKNDKSFYVYEFSVSDIAGRFHIDRDNMYRSAHQSIARLFNCNLKVGTEKEYELLHLFRTAKYKDGVFTMQLSEETDKLFLQLKRNFTSVPLLPVLAMKSKSSIRIFEAICEKLMGHMPYADNAVNAYISVEELRKVTETVNAKSYDHMSHFKRKVINPSVEEIERAANWKILVKNVKKSRTVIGINFEIWSRNGWEYIEDCKRKGILPKRGNAEQLPGQMSLFDYLQ